MSRLTAALIHLGISLSVILLLAAITFFVWYPHPHYKYEGVLTILGLITFVDVVLGPLFTFIVFKQGKPSLRFDLTVIALVQIAAFIYGTHTIYSQHPEFVTYAEGGMITIPTSAIDEQQIADTSLKRRFHIGPKLAITSLPDDPQTVVDFTVAQITQNKTLLDYPEFYSTYPPKLSELAENALNIEKLSENLDNETKIERFLNRKHLSQDDVYFLKLISNLRSSVIVLDSTNGAVIGYLNIRP